MPRHNIKKYDPAKESSPGQKERAKELGLLVLTIDSRKDNQQLLTCLCGCGKTPAGKKSLFAMGHDARLRGMLQRAHLTGTKVLEVVDGIDRKPRTAMSVAKEHDWGRYLEQAETAREGKNRQVLNKAMGSKRLIKVGRWEYTGQVVAIYDIPGNGQEYEVEYVTKLGDVKKKRVPASDTKEVKV